MILAGGEPVLARTLSPTWNVYKLGFGCYRVVRKLTRAQIQSLNTSPITLVAGAANKIFRANQALFILDSGTAFSADVDLMIGPTTALASNLSWLTNDNIIGLDLGADSVVTGTQTPFLDVGGTITKAAIAQDLKVKSSADVTLGGASDTLTVMVDYTIDDCSVLA